jgi:hypothetical protein
VIFFLEKNQTRGNGIDAPHEGRIRAARGTLKKAPAAVAVAWIAASPSGSWECLLVRVKLACGATEANGRV